MNHGKETVQRDLRAAAEAAATALLVEHEGCYSMRDLIASAWMRGHVSGFAAGCDSALDQMTARIRPAARPPKAVRL